METKSPLKQKPLPNPGSSLDSKISSLIDEKFTPWILASVMFMWIAVLEWWRFYMPRDPNPWLFTSISVVVFLITTWRIQKLRMALSPLRQGRDGEIAVGQFLERCREQGARVFHDIPSKNFNLDHVIIHTSGIYVIETKTISKPASGEAVLIFDGNTIRCEGMFSTDNPITQVLAAKNWLSMLLQESTGKRLSSQLIRPVVVYPGWYVQVTPEAKKSSVWVLNPKALPDFIRYGKDQLSSEDVHLYSLHLSKYTRSYKDGYHLDSV